jgi:AcrR family transcriptional regulator
LSHSNPDPSATRARTRRYRERKDAILKAAVQLMNERGVKGMTLGDVAARLELVPTAVIYYYKNKEDLAAACFEAGIARYNDLLTLAEQSPPTDQLRAFVSAFFEDAKAIAEGRLAQIALFNDVRALQNPDVNAAYVALFRRTRALLQNALPEARERLDLNARTHLLLSQLFWSVAWRNQFEPADYGRVAARFYSILTGGIRAAPGAWKPKKLPLPETLSGLTDDTAKEDFLRAATDLINSTGYLGASVDRIAANMNVTKGAFYYHFEAKDDLVQACFERTLLIVRTAQELGLKAGATGWDHLSSSTTALVQHQLGGDLPVLRTSALTTVPSEIRNSLLSRFARISNGFAGTLSDGVADGSIRAIDPIIASQMITAVINACAELHFWAPGIGPETVGRIYARPALEGIFV